MARAGALVGEDTVTLGRTQVPLDKDELVLGLLAAPGRPTEVAEALAEDLPGLLADRVSDAVSWRVPVRTDPAVADLSHGVEAIDLARERLLRDGWDMAVCITDAPLRIGRRPVVADASATHGVALISLPALGAVQTRRRARDAVIRLVDGLVGESLELGERGVAEATRAGQPSDRRALAAPIRAVEPPERRRRSPLRRCGGAREPAAVGRHGPRQPALAPDRATLARAGGRRRGGALRARDLGPLGAGGCARLGSPAVLTVLSVGATVALADRLAPPVGARGRGEGAVEQTVLFNVGNDAHAAARRRVLYAALFALTSWAAALVIDAGCWAQALGHDAGVGDYAALAWMASSLGTIAGGLGAGLESDEAVREAAYGYRVERASERDSRVPARA